MLHGGLFLVNTALRRKLQTDIECHSDLLFVHHHIRYFKHGGQVVSKIDHAAVAAGEGHEGNIVQGGQLFKNTANGGPGQSPAGSKFRIGDQRVAGAIAKIGYRPKTRPLHLTVVVDGRNP